MKPFLLIKILILYCVFCGSLGLVWAQGAAESSSASIASGAIWVVALDGTGQFMSIQEAIDQSHSGDTIIIKPGKYNEDVTVHSKERLKVIGAGTKKVFIAGLNRVGTLHIGKWPYGATNVEISGMTIQQHGGLGVGIFNGSGVTLRNIHVNGLIFGQQVQNVLIENCIVGESETTGMAFADSEATLVRNFIHDNDHGVSISGVSKVTLLRNVITRSLFEAVLVGDKGQASLVQNTLVKNGGGVKFQDESLGEIRGNIISDSKVGVAYLSKTNITRSHNAFHNNKVHEQINGMTVPTNSKKSSATALYVKPQFVDPDHGDFHLKNDSPLLGIGGFDYMGALEPLK